jgi:HME family heavy-metal exporter
MAKVPPPILTLAGFSVGKQVRLLRNRKYVLQAASSSATDFGSGTGQDLSVAGMVGFISLGGIAARNGLLLVSTYLDLGKERGFSQNTRLQGSLDRLAPVLMTSLTTGLALVPLVVGGHLPGKEILFPVATVILGGLTSSVFCEFLLRPGLCWMLPPNGAFPSGSLKV